jgi:hypothetical protein
MLLKNDNILFLGLLFLAVYAPACRQAGSYFGKCHTELVEVLCINFCVTMFLESVYNEEKS